MIEMVDALELALDDFRRSVRPLQHRGRELKGASRLLQIVAGDTVALEEACTETGHNEKIVQEAAAIFLRRWLTAPSQDDRGLLLLNRDATAADLKNHKRWLLKWLHPDRNHSRWDSKLFQRIVEAAARLEEAPLEPPKLPTAASAKLASNRTVKRTRPHPLRNDRLDRHVDKAGLAIRSVKLLVALAVIFVGISFATRWFSDHPFSNAQMISGSNP